ncbi:MULTISPECIES: hypothetical protein [Brevundimonas]|uniref:Uncharacterized protein n=1 Tax=Brevundimonas abyssalis TAR-001 TaxID=1391729 RepID=A0A8E0KM68_9CAUL|nr:MULTISPECIES: hypothetical protein [Brevundimonas]GAD58282.1 hypothetical protein MBEBAB_0532 [Brevundimonas abyssalis TAR-001]
MTPSATAIPTITWDDLEAVYDDLAITREEKETVAHLLTATRLLSPHLTPLDLTREIICIAFVLTRESDRLPSRPIQRLSGLRPSG